MKQLEITSLISNKENFACAFTGHRVLENDFSLNKLKKAVEKLIKEEHVITFYCGMAIGFDLLAGELIAKLKKKYPIKLVACIPYYGQEKAFSKEDKERYVNLLKVCDEQVLISEHYYRGCFLKRNKYMADNSDFLIAYLRTNQGGTYYTVNYFKKKKAENILFI